MNRMQWLEKSLTRFQCHSARAGHSNSVTKKDGQLLDEGPGIPNHSGSKAFVPVIRH